MDFEDSLDLEEFLFVDRQCRKCLRTLSLVDYFYKTRPDRGKNMSAYSYICKQCTIKNNTRYRRNKRPWITDYPDW